MAKSSAARSAPVWPPEMILLVIIELTGLLGAPASLPASSNVSVHAVRDAGVPRAFLHCATPEHAAIIKTVPDDLKTIAAALGLEKYKRHIFLCADQTEPKCAPKEKGLESWEYLK